MSATRTRDSQPPADPATSQTRNANLSGPGHGRLLKPICPAVGRTLSLHLQNKMIESIFEWFLFFINRAVCLEGRRHVRLSRTLLGRGVPRGGRCAVTQPQGRRLCPLGQGPLSTTCAVDTHLLRAGSSLHFGDRTAPPPQMGPHAHPQTPYVTLTNTTLQVWLREGR